MPSFRNLIRPMAAALSLLLAAACSVLPQSGPNMRGAEEAAAARGIDYTVLTPATVAGFQAVTRPDVPLSAPIKPGQLALRIGAGDVLRIQMFETTDTGSLFAGASSAGVLSRVAVDEKGYITLPYAGRLRAAGRSPAQLQSAIAKRLAELTVEPAAYVEIVADHSNSVMVSGAVAKAGRVSLRGGVAGAIDAINISGGVTKEPWHMEIILRRDKTVARLNYADMLNGGDFALRPGDRLLVDYRPRRFVALGSIKAAGAYDFPARDISLLTALATARGLSDQQSDRTGIYVFRRSNRADGKDHLFAIDMAQPDSPFVADRFAMKAGDAIFVTNALLTDINKVLEPILRSLAIFRFASDPLGTN